MSITDTCYYTHTFVPDRLWRISLFHMHSSHSFYWCVEWTGAIPSPVMLCYKHCYEPTLLFLASLLLTVLSHFFMLFAYWHIFGSSTIGCSPSCNAHLLWALCTEKLFIGWLILDYFMMLYESVYFKAFNKHIAVRSLNQVYCVYNSGAYCYVDSCCFSLTAKYLPHMCEIFGLEVWDCICKRRKKTGVNIILNHTTMWKLKRLTTNKMIFCHMPQCFKTNEVAAV